MRAAGTAPAEEAEERWDRVWVSITPEQRARFDEAMALAGRVLGATAPKWERLEAICSEYLGTHGGGVSDVEKGAGGELLKAPVASWLDAVKEALEVETRRWAFLDELSPVAAVGAPPLALEDDPLRLDAALREVSALRDRWDEVLGHLALLLRMFGLWHDMKFASFGQYCAERLGMAGRTVEQRAWLARRCYALPGLREALRDKRVSYEKARAIAGCADHHTIERWIDRAANLTCVELQREAEAHEETQMCAPGELRLRLPRRVVSLLAAALRAAREAAGGWLDQGACLERVATHFIETCQGMVPRARTPEAKAIERDQGLCQVPGCSRSAAHAHHVLYRSRGGGDELANLTALCAPHHLAGVHRGYLRVQGAAPDRLSWDAPALPR